MLGLKDLYCLTPVYMFMRLARCGYTGTVTLNFMCRNYVSRNYVSRKGCDALPERTRTRRQLGSDGTGLGHARALVERPSVLMRFNDARNDGLASSPR